MLIIPAIDLKNGQAVRLIEGRLGTERQVSPDPVAQAQAFEQAGAERIHVVDLDGAFEGAPKNKDLIRTICRAVSVPVQVGGGLRNATAVHATLEAGARYAIIGTLAVEDPDAFSALCRQFPGQIIAGVDGKKGRVATEGWVHTSSRSIEEVARFAESAGATAVVSTDIARDGTGQGVNVEASQALAKTLSIPLIASGGVHDESDIRKLAQTQVAGVVIGRAIYDGTLDLKAALRLAQEGAQ